MRREYLSGLGALNFSMSFSREIRNFKKGLFWSLQLCAMPSNNKYLEAPFSQKIADIFLCIAMGLIALSAIMLFQESLHEQNFIPICFKDG